MTADFGTAGQAMWNDVHHWPESEPWGQRPERNAEYEGYANTVLDWAAEQRNARGEVVLCVSGISVTSPPRVFRASDPEPDGAQAVLDADGDVWQRRQDGWPWILDDEVPMTWDELLHTYGPVVEVILPAPVTK